MQHFASIISIPFLSHSSLNIFPISAFCTLGQTPDDTYIPISYVINYFCPLDTPPVIFIVVGKPTLFLSHGGVLLEAKAFLTT